jgi:putative MATE family efflux protein
MPVGEKNFFQPGSSVTAVTKVQIRREIFSLAVPALGAFAAPSLFLLVDSWVVASLGAPALAGLSTASAVIVTITGLLIFLTFGTTTQVARAFGANQPELVKRNINNSLTSSIFLGLILTTLVIIFSKQLSSLLGTPESASYAQEYLIYASLGIFFLILNLALVGILRGVSDTKTTLWVSLISVLINLVLVILLVKVLDFGIKGSAIGTSVAAFSGSVLFLIALKKKHNIQLTSIEFSLKPLMIVIKENLALMWRTLMLRLSLLAALYAATLQGTLTLAAFQVMLAIWMGLALILDSLEVAAQVMSAKAYGAKDITLLNLTNKTLLQYAWILGIILFVLLSLLYGFGPELFTENPLVHDLVRSIWLLLALMQILNAVVFVTDGILMGMNDFKFLAIVQTLGLFGLVGFLFFADSLFLILMAMVIWMLIRLVFQLWRVQVGLKA